MTCCLVKYSLWCPDHSETLETDYRTEDQGVPTCCPLNEAHTNISGIAIISVIDETIKSTRIIDACTLDPDTALGCAEDVVVDVAIGEQVSKKDVSFPFDINIIASEYYVDILEWTKEDYFEIWGIAQGDPAIGALTAPAALEDTIINVNPTVFENLRPGYYVEFQDQTIDKMYRVDGVDSGVGTITLAEGLEEAVDSGKTVHLRRPFFPKKFVKEKVISRIGDLQSGSIPLIAGDILRIHYHHYVEPTVVDWMAYTIIYMF